MRNAFVILRMATTSHAISLLQFSHIRKRILFFLVIIKNTSQYETVTFNKMTHKYAFKKNTGYIQQLKTMEEMYFRMKYSSTES